MGICKYCGRSAGLLRKQHSACATKYKDGWNQMIQLVLQEARDELVDRRLLPTLTEIAENHFMTGEHVQSALVEGWLRAVDQFLDDHLLTEAEEQKLVAFREQYQLPATALEKAPGQDRLQKARALRAILEGRFPSSPSKVLPHVFNFQKSEKLVWIFDSVQYYEDRTRRQYVGGHSGVSIRVMTGVYYRTGTFTGHPVDRTETVHIGTGDFAVTNKHLYFHSPAKAFRVRHDKIVAVVPYSDGIEVQRDAATAKPQKFVTGDGWFLYNVVLNAPHLEG